MTKRVLFVDDETQVLDGLRCSMRKQRKEWDMVFVASGEAALQECRRSPFDVVVSDMRMPGMDGATLLTQVREEFPSTIRIILSGHSEREAVIRALPVCHQFLAKPCDGEALRLAIDRALGLQILLDDAALRQVVGKLDNLPSLPRVYNRLAEVMRAPSCSAKDVARVIESDPGISAKLLKIVNSSFFGLAQRVSSPERAVSYLGVDLVRTLVLSAEVFSPSATPRGLSIEDVQAHAILTSSVARKLAKSAGDDAATAGLLHDIGELVLALEFPDRLAEVNRRLELEPALSVGDAEKQVLGVRHADVGGYLVGLWGLPVAIVEAVALHHEPHRAGPPSDVVAAVHVAGALVASSVGKRSGRTTTEHPDAACLARFGDPEAVTAMVDECVARWFSDPDAP